MLSVTLFGLTQSILFAIAALALLAYILYLEFKTTKSAAELLPSVAAAVGAWLVLSFLLNTTVPINIITSCSMLPAFERGDMIILAGPPFSAPTMQVPYALGNATYQTMQIAYGGQVVARILQPTVGGTALFEPEIGACERVKGTRPETQPCLKAITIGSQRAEILQSPDVIVYDSNTSAGPIIHRLFAVLNATDGEYYLTKGDNNNFLDQQSGFYIIPARSADRMLLSVPFVGAVSWKGGSLAWQSEPQFPIKGKVLLRIPYVGYIKLLAFLQIQAPEGCDSVLQKPAQAATLQ